MNTSTIERENASARSFDFINELSSRYSDKSTFMPESGWSAGVAKTSKTVLSNLPSKIFWAIADSKDYNEADACAIDSIGVTADQLYEAWLLFGSSVFSRISETLEYDNSTKYIISYLRDTSATKDLRFVYCLVGRTLDADITEIVPLAKKMGYTEFFSMAWVGMSLAQILHIDNNDIDAMLIEALNGDY